MIHCSTAFLLELVSRLCFIKYNLVMVKNPETENKAIYQASESVQEVPESPEIPREIEQGGVQARPTQFTATVQDDTGQHLVQSPANQTITIEIPADPQQLLVWSDGPPTESLTWYAYYWLRIIKKAIKKGWKTIVRGGYK